MLLLPGLGYEKCISVVDGPFVTPFSAMVGNPAVSEEELQGYGNYARFSVQLFSQL